MAVESGAEVTAKPARHGWRAWMRLALAALLLLLLSEALWLWQTWPVRELLQSLPPQRTPTQS
jgi:hypothetical protein